MIAIIVNGVLLPHFNYKINFKEIKVAQGIRCNTVTSIEVLSIVDERTAWYVNGVKIDVQHASSRGFILKHEDRLPNYCIIEACPNNGPSGISFGEQKINSMAQRMFDAVSQLIKLGGRNESSGCKHSELPRKGCSYVGFGSRRVDTTTQRRT